MPVPALTFAIPYYEGNDPVRARLLLEKTIHSVLAQTVEDWELLICHNGGAYELLNNLVHSFNDSRITLIHNGTNIGATGNFNVCIDRARTPLVTLVHSDDKLLPNYASCLLETAKNYPNATLYYCQATIIDELDHPKFSMPDYVKGFIQPKPSGSYIILEGESALERLLRGNFIFCPTICFRKAILGQNRFSENWKSVQDFELLTRLLLNGHFFVGANEIAYAYRRHSSNHTVEYRRNLTLFYEEIKIFDHLSKLCKELSWFKAESTAKSKVIIRLNLFYCGLIDIVNGHFSNFYNKFSLILTMKVK